MFLNDLEVTKVEAFCADEVMFEAVKKVLLQSIYSQGTLAEGEPANPLKNRALVLVGGDYNDAELGLRLRALWEGVNALESGFDALEGYKTPAPEKKDVEENPAI
jgi:hypothetical protein